MVAIEQLLFMRDASDVVERVDDVGSHEDDDVAIVDARIISRKEGADKREPAEARHPGLCFDRGIIDHAAENEEMVVGDMDGGFHGGFTGGNATDVGGEAVRQGNLVLCCIELPCRCLIEVDVESYNVRIAKVCY